MKIYQHVKILVRQVICAFLMLVTVTFASNQVLAKALSTESLDKANNSHDVLFEEVVSSESLSWFLTADQWEIVRNGESILSHAVLSDVVRTWLSSVKNLQNNARPLKSEIIEIHYPGGEEGEVWIQELTDWLVALGVPSRFISVVPGSAADDEIRFQLHNK